jgi:hypothetical protein
MSKPAQSIQPPPIPRGKVFSGDGLDSGWKISIDAHQVALRDAVLAERARIAAFVNDLVVGKTEPGIQLTASNVIEFLMKAEG